MDLKSTDQKRKEEEARRNAQHSRKGNKHGVSDSCGRKCRCDDCRSSGGTKIRPG